MTRCVVVNIWIGLESAECDGPPAARDVELEVRDEKIVEARLVEPRVRYACHAIPLPLLVAMIGAWRWEAFERDAAALARRQSEDPDVRAFDAEEAARDRADEANDYARAL